MKTVLKNNDASADARSRAGLAALAESAIFAAVAAALCPAHRSCTRGHTIPPTPQLQNSKFRPEPQLVNMTTGNSTSQSLSGSHGGRFSWFRLKKVDIFSVKDFLIVCDCGVWPAAVRRLAVPRGCCSSSLRKPLKWIADFSFTSIRIFCNLKIDTCCQIFLAVLASWCSANIIGLVLVSWPCGGETWLKAAAVAAVVWIGARCMIHPRAAATDQLSCDKNTICHASVLRVEDFSLPDDSNLSFLSGCWFVLLEFHRQ